ncbi:MAG TPA: peptidylprolyl isomerase [Bacteriovoracaceae bacterium]|nr:peptidylprolyl isomerase [Bacteriovoracaceae bacterium]
MKTLFLLLLSFFSFSLFANPVVVMDTNFGKIEVELDEKKAPVTVKNFLTYVDARFYDGTIFHRVIDNFMIQGGGFLSGMKEKPNKKSPIKNEANNGLKNDIGTIAMARTNAPHSATAQFFINVSDNEFLNHKSETDAGWGYAVFGKVTSGMHVVNRIKKVKTGNIAGHANVPMDEVVIKSIRRK